MLVQHAEVKLTFASHTSGGVFFSVLLFLDAQEDSDSASSEELAR